jgi:hypothetical protein
MVWHLAFVVALLPPIGPSGSEDDGIRFNPICSLPAQAVLPTGKPIKVRAEVSFLDAPPRDWSLEYGTVPINIDQQGRPVQGRTSDPIPGFSDRLAYHSGGQWSYEPSLSARKGLVRLTSGGKTLALKFELTSVEADVKPGSLMFYFALRRPDGSITGAGFKTMGLMSSSQFARITQRVRRPITLGPGGFWFGGTDSYIPVTSVGGTLGPSLRLTPERARFRSGSGTLYHFTIHTVGASALKNGDKVHFMTWPFYDDGTYHGYVWPNYKLVDGVDDNLPTQTLTFENGVTAHDGTVDITQDGTTSVDLQIHTHKPSASTQFMFFYEIKDSSGTVQDQGGYPIVITKSGSMMIQHQHHSPNRISERHRS